MGKPIDVAELYGILNKIDFIKHKPTNEYEKGYMDGLEFATNLIEKIADKYEK